MENGSVPAKAYIELEFGAWDLPDEYHAAIQPYVDGSIYVLPWPTELFPRVGEVVEVRYTYARGQGVAGYAWVHIDATKPDLDLLLVLSSEGFLFEHVRLEKVLIEEVLCKAGLRTAPEES